MVRLSVCVLSLALALPIVFLGWVQAQRAARCRPVRIMPLGDSITVGKGSGGTNFTVTDTMTGYRQPLYQQLTAAGYAVDFVGGEQAGRLATPSFDINHEGHSGYSPSEIAYANRMTGQGGITTWLAANAADVVLLHIDTNTLKRQDDTPQYARLWQNGECLAGNRDGDPAHLHDGTASRAFPKESTPYIVTYTLTTYPVELIYLP